ncbi:hypothetical protein AB1Y20_020713 [Prymnesium parvum]|uniref:EF-hand domain-containing protein n=1 Tax=Prymnesium parvum TaxID=97485 RepID=A0AB34JVF3_PRYPA
MQPSRPTSLPDGADPRSKPDLRLVNNGLSVNTPGHQLSSRPAIFRAGPQILHLPSRPPPRPAAAALPSHERLFGASRPQPHESTSAELGRLQIHTVRQLHRALRHRLVQAARPAGLAVAFHRLATHATPADAQAAADVDDLRRAVAAFNLRAPDELVAQLHSLLDTDHDGLLSMSEFAGGLRDDSSGIFQLQQEDCAISSRRYYKTIGFYHPLHNAPTPSQLQRFTEL